MRTRRSLGWPVGAVVMLAASSAWADRVALLPGRGPDEAANNAATIETTRALIALGHTVVPVQEVTAAVTGSTDGLPDTPDELRAVGKATKADWVLVGKIEPAVLSEHIELEASLVSIGRVESVAREVEKAHSEAQIKEMLAVLLRPEGIGAGEMPWERGAVAPQAKPVAAPPPPPSVAAAPPPPPEPSGPPVASLDYMSTTDRVWPPYSAGHGGFIAGALGFSAAVSKPGAASGASSSMVGDIRAGYAPGASGLEIFGQFGGNLVGPRALWFDLGGRLMLTPGLSRGPDGVLRGLAFHIGPELTVGGFARLAGPDVVGPDGVRYSSSSDVHFALGGALDLAISVTQTFQIEARLGNVRWVPTSEGSLLLAGATLGAGLRF